MVHPTWCITVKKMAQRMGQRNIHRLPEVALGKTRPTNLLKREPTKKRGIKSKLLNAGWDHADLLRLLGVEI